MFPAFGLYTHIRANRIRSIVLIVALVLLVYVLTFAGALFAQSLGGDASLDMLLARAGHDLLVAAPVVTLAQRFGCSSPIGSTSVSSTRDGSEARHP